jgi:AbrB family looped-hinge helix DNA binding protein
MQIHLSMAENGRVLIPAEVRAAIGLKAGGKVVARVENGALVIEPLDAAIRRVQEAMKPYTSPGESLVDELIADRRREAE